MIGLNDALQASFWRNRLTSLVEARRHVMEKRVHSRRRDVGIIFEVELSIESRPWIAPECSTNPKIVYSRIDTEFEYVWITLEVPGVVKQP
jgi:hypothetical protein